MGRPGQSDPIRHSGTSGYRRPDHRAGRPAHRRRGRTPRPRRWATPCARGQPGIGKAPNLAELETSVERARVHRQALAEERAALARASVDGFPPEDPHAHLRHRALPNVAARTRSRVLRVWSAVSASILLAGLAVVILGHFGALVPAFGSLAAVMLCVEAFARGHVWQFVAGLLGAAVVAFAVWLATEAVIGNWQLALAALLFLAALALLFANIRDFFVRR